MATGNGSVVDIVKAVSPAVVTIVADGITSTDPQTGQTQQGTATGSGVIFDANGLILTNHHVVAGDPQKLTVNLKDGRSLDATIYGIDTLTDLAIVKVQATGLPTAPIGDSSTIQVGQQAIAIGSPLGEFTDSVTSGIISALGRSIPVESGEVLTTSSRPIPRSTPATAAARCSIRAARSSASTPPAPAAPRASASRSRSTSPARS